MNILAIETSCDETSIALVEAHGGLRAPRFSVSENLVSSQIPIHRPFGGVVPNLAKREHLKNLPILFEKLMGKNFQFPISNFQKRKLPVDLITVTVGPGLEPALWTGINFAKELAREYKKPLVGANHLEGHLYSFLLPSEKTKSMDPRLRGGDANVVFPAVVLIVSGGHTILLRMESFSKWRRLGETRDDAAGEAFDKVARLLELPYPGGPEIEKLARKGNPAAIAFPRPMLHEKNYDFSFSGLKTAVLYYLRNPNLRTHPNETNKKNLIRSIRINSDRSDWFKADIAASFQQASIDVLVQKTMRAAEEYNARSIMLGGGVAANAALKKALGAAAKKADYAFFAPAKAYYGDNAAMIGAAGYMAYLRKKTYRLSAQGTLDI